MANYVRQLTPFHSATMCVSCRYLTYNKVIFKKESTLVWFYCDLVIKCFKSKSKVSVGKRKKKNFFFQA